ncbi:hypothetical protein SteCoe_2339 [Stentor coeruleus]|uniref:Uncharacterized protein n=1 Tax=Stentor coeruleus TaxID=5963 RepID=A0A1R2CZN2_9CILI|nr:hypothetical protein SteCoe_2339 [Stentor coeruleus]
MYRIRDKPVSARPGRSPAIRKLQEESEINDSIQAQKILKSKLSKRSRAKHFYFIRSHNSSNKESRSTSAHRKDITIDQIEILKEELDLTWRNFKIPEQHKKVFIKSLESIPKIQAASKIAREIDNIEKGNANITSVISAINKRESLLQEIQKKFEEKLTKPEIFSHIKLLQNLRDLTLRAIEFIEFWKSEYSLTEQFQWINCIYYDKLKSDTNFLCETSLGKFFNFCLSDPLLTGPTEPKVINKREFSIPFSYRQGSRVRKTFDILSFTPSQPLKIRSSIQLNEIPCTASEVTHTEISQIFQTELQISDIENRKEINEICKMILENMIYKEVNTKLEVYVTQSFKEIIAASLTLYSSSILDRVITEVLSELIPVIAKESHTEVTDSEYIDIRNLIINEVMEEQIQTISGTQINNILSIYVTEEVIGYLELFQITLQTIQEEMKENQSIVYIVADKIIEEFLIEDWAEDVAELELVQAKMENVWKDLPGHIQKEIYHHQKENIILRLCEMVYFGILNEFVGKIWLEGLVGSVIKEERNEEKILDEDIFLLKDPNYQVEEPRKGVHFRRKK